LQLVFSRKSFVASFKVAFKRFFFRLNRANVETEFVIIRESRRTERAFLQILLIVVSSFVAHQRRVKPERFAAQVAQERAVSFAKTDISWQRKSQLGHLIGDVSS
jgi:hypothetical protein